MCYTILNATVTTSGERHKGFNLEEIIIKLLRKWMSIATNEPGTSTIGEHLLNIIE